MVDNEPRPRSTIAAADGSYFSPVDHSAYEGCRRQYDGLLQIMVLYKYNPETQLLYRVRGGGGFTWGAEAEKHHCGWSWWAACTADNACGSDWLVVHEFGHQLDSMFEQSNHPEIWFNHLANIEGNIARFGEHFDANSYILRRIPENAWHDLKWGEVHEYTDLDQDNVPDDDPFLSVLNLDVDPDAGAMDADEDGLSDYQELMATNGIRTGHGERLFPSLSLCDPLNRDTDGDGLIDGEDPLPMLPMSRYIPGIRPDEKRPPARLVLAYEDLSFHLGLAYNGEYDWEESELRKELIIQISAGDKLASGTGHEMKIMLDLDNNGWFAGDDNYRIDLNETGVQSIFRHKAAGATEWPYLEDIDLASLAYSIQPLKDTAAGRYGFELTLPSDAFPELAAKPGEVIGINTGIKRKGERWYYMISEPNTLLPLELR